MVNNNLQIIKNILELYQDIGVSQIPHYISKESLQTYSNHQKETETLSTYTHQKGKHIPSNTLTNIATTTNTTLTSKNMTHQTPQLITIEPLLFKHL